MYYSAVQPERHFLLSSASAACETPRTPGTAKKLLRPKVGEALVLGLSDSPNGAAMASSNPTDPLSDA